MQRNTDEYGDESQITVIPCLRFIPLDLDFLLQLFIYIDDVLGNFIDVCAFLPSNTCSKITGIITQLQQTAIFIATHISNVHKWLKLFVHIKLYLKLSMFNNF